MEIKKELVHALAIASFLLQLILFVRSRHDSFVVPIIVAVSVHVLYFVRVIRRNEIQYKQHFLYYEIGVVAFELFMFSSLPNFYDIVDPLFWIVALPLSMQVATCYVLYLHNRQSKDDPPHVINPEDDEKFKKGLVNVINMIAFPLQLVFYGIYIGSYPTTMTVVGSTALIIVSILVHIRYFLRVIRKGENEFKSCFFYYQIGVAIIQSNVALSYDTASYFVLPLLVQAIACTSLYFHSDNNMEDSDIEQLSSDGLPSYLETVEKGDEEQKNTPVEFPEVPVAAKT